MVKDRFVNNVKKKANISNRFFAEECTPIKMNQVLRESRLCSFDFVEDEILKIIRDLNIHKTHGHDDIPIRITKICEKSLFKPLILLFHN